MEKYFGILRACPLFENIRHQDIPGRVGKRIFQKSRLYLPGDSNCHFHCQLIYNLVKIIAAKNVRFHRKPDIFSRRTTKEKLLAYLSYIAAENDSRSFYIPFS